MRTLLALLVTQVAVVSVAEARETGDIVGRVVDIDALVVPGLEVVLTGAELAGTRTDTTDDDGRFRFDGLLPGTYALEVRRDGIALAGATVTVRMETATQVPLVVDLANTPTEIVVVDVQPVIDTTRSAFSHSLSEEYLQNLPTGRSYQDVVNTLPGVYGRIDTQDGGGGTGNPSVRGSGQYGNTYTIDGVTNRDPATNTFGQNLNFDAIEEIQVYTDGAPAEFGQFTGMVANVQIKDGGDEHHGSAAVFYSQHAWFTPTYLIYDAAEGKEVETEKRRFRTPNLVFTAGGPIVKEKLWYFVGGDVTYAWAQPEGVPADQARSSWSGNVLAKLTWFATPATTLRLLFTDDFTFSDAENAGPLVAREALENRRDNSFTTLLTATIKPQWHTELVVRGGYQQIGINVVPASGDELQAAVQDADGRLLHNARNFDYNTRRRAGGGLVFTRLFEKALGTHKFKTGAEYWFLQSQRELIHTGRTTIDWVDTNGQLDPARQGLDVGTEYSANPALGYDCTQPDGSDCGFREHWTNVGPLGTQVHTFFVFAQDDWTPVPFLTFNLGFRLDVERGLNDVGNGPPTQKPSEYGLPAEERFEGQLEALYMPAPRVGFSLDLTRDNKTKLSGHYGWYYDVQGADFWEWANTRSSAGYVRYARDAGGDWVWSNTQDNVLNPLIYDEAFQPPKTERINLAIEREIIPLLSISLRGILSRTTGLAEDVDTNLNDFYILNSAQKARIYRGLELVLEKKFDGVWQLLGSYTLSESYGHTPGQFETASGADVGSNGNNVGVYLDDVGERDARAELYDAGQGWILDGLAGLGRQSVTDPSYADEAGWLGYLPYHSFHQLKINGSYTAPWGTTFGLIYEFDSGHAWQKRTFVPFYGYDGFAQGRGTRFMPAVHYVDVRVAHTFRLRGAQSVELSVDIFNVPDLGTPITYWENDTEAFGLTLFRQAPRGIRGGLKYRW